MKSKTVTKSRAQKKTATQVAPTKINTAQWVLILTALFNHVRNWIYNQIQSARTQVVSRYKALLWVKNKKPSGGTVQPLTILETFSGIGGTRLGAEQAGFKVVAASEIDKHCIATYQDNFGDCPFGDITQLNAETVPNFDVLTASTPCQSFSTQGKRKGLKDKRGELIYDVFRIADAHPEHRVLFIENVKGMATTNGGRGLKTVLKELHSRGYYTHHQVLKASHYGVPQARERLFIVAFRENVPFSFPKPTVLAAASGEILENSVHKNYFLSQEQIDTLVQAKDRYDKNGDNFGFEIIDPAKPTHTILRSTSSLLKNLVAVPLEKSAPKNRGVYDLTDKDGNTKKVHLRKLTPRECARLQGYPDSYELTASASESYKQLGNSVPVPVIRELFKEILVSLTLWDKGVRVTKNTAKRIDPVPPQKNVIKKNGNTVSTKRIKAPKVTATMKVNKKQKAQPATVSKQDKTQPVTTKSGTPKMGLALVKGGSVTPPPVFIKPGLTDDKKLSGEISGWYLKDKKNHQMTPNWLVVFLNFICPLELDAATGPEANSIHKFKRILTKKDNSLKRSWKVSEGNGVFVNPPYNDKNGLMAWAEKMDSEYKKHGQPIFALVPAWTPESKWFRCFSAKATHIVFLKERLTHNETVNKKSAMFPSAVFVFGGDLLGNRFDYLSQLGMVLETETYRKSKAQLQTTKAA
ncbi:MAG: DNA (cytosine-5-)-methyltransferase [Bdellovibrionales bacterium]|nr:DNA (cytosine-5-)-methyltransferase [Bdellovibrionales bacterium]